MFIISQKDTFTWPVQVEIPGEGKAIKAQFTAEFRRLPQSRMDEILAADTPPSDAELVREVMVGWKDVKDEAGTELEFNQVNLAQLLEVTGMRAIIGRAFMEAMLGGAKRKN